MSSGEELSQIVKLLKQEETRWDAILQLKVLDGDKWVDSLIPLLSDQDWVIRWCVAEKLGDVGDKRAIMPLIRLLTDSDFHVRKNVSKALIKFGPVTLPALVPYFAHRQPTVRRQVMSILLASGPSIIPNLERLLPHQEWVVGNRLVDIIWRLGGKDAEHALILALKHPFLQAHTIVLLGVMKSKRAIPYLLQAFEIARLRRIIVYALYRIGAKESYPTIVQSLQSPSKAVATLSQQLVIKIGDGVLPYLLKELERGVKDKKIVAQAIVKIGASKVKGQLQQLAKHDPELLALLRSLK